MDEADIRAGLAVFRTIFTLVGLRAVGTGRRAPRRSPAEDKAAKDFLKHIRMQEGKAAEAGRTYPHSQIYVRKPNNKGYWILDYYDPATREIVSFKDTQLASVKPKTAIGFLTELKRKYSPGRIIADVPSNNRAIVGKPLEGRMILEVPVQNNPIPKSVLEKAASLDIQVRDVAGRVY